MKTYEKQYVTTRFIIIGLPLIPVESLFVVDDMSYIELGLNIKSIFKTYLAWITFAIATILLVGSQFENVFPLSSGISFFIGLISLIISIYFFFVFQKTTEQENEVRDLFQKAIGMSLLPEYFNYDKSFDFQKKLIQTLKDKFGINNWRNTIKNNDYNEAQLPLLFTICAFQHKMSKSKISQENYDKLLNEYKNIA
ncbi:hypothetical protein HSX10_12530 [Winogradskyella undariae]|uniref:hypothetical protein n=1 Tax=Winogradskyella undariae TaxID=1285465 RepID=UPI00156B87D4|nr:hypothetical protein [Winogradskyella undariae]NRR92395.1 hypothetical protein [Winogradskyella undariae]